MTKTPKFDVAIDKILSDLEPHERVCETCSQSFRVEAEDVSLLKKLRVPPPKICPLCRKIQRFAHLMRALKFFKRPCQVPRHTEDVITVFPPTAPQIVYDYAYWNSDACDGADYGIEFDATQPFFQEFKRLYFRVPQCPLDRDINAVNSDYSVGGMGAKNAYYCAMPHHAENVAYCLSAEYSRDCIDLTQSAHNELCYDLVTASNCSRSKYLVDCMECLDSSFLYDCRNCSSCFMSSNIRNGTHVFRNERLDKAEYERRMRETDFGSRAVISGLKQEFESLVANSITRAVRNTNVANVIGDWVVNSKDCYFGFNGLGNCENVRFADNFEDAKDCIDIVNAAGTEMVYASVITKGNNIYFSISNRNSSDLEYCISCHNSHYCFGCVGVKNKKFYIFNKPFEESEYWLKVDEIKTTMLERGEYGNFFPYHLELMPYQASSAQKWFPISTEEAKQRGIAWYEEPETVAKNIEILTPEQVPDNITAVSDDILSKAIACEVTRKPFRIIPTELNFYRLHNIPLPVRHPLQRLADRGAYEHARWLYTHNCASCGEVVQCAILPEHQKALRIYCEKCYLREVA